MATSIFLLTLFAAAALLFLRRPRPAGVLPLRRPRPAGVLPEGAA